MITVTSDLECVELYDEERGDGIDKDTVVQVVSSGEQSYAWLVIDKVHVKVNVDDLLQAVINAKNYGKL